MDFLMVLRTVATIATIARGPVGAPRTGHPS